MAERNSHQIWLWRLGVPALLLAVSAMMASDDAHGVGVAQVMKAKSLPPATVAVIDPETGTSSGSSGDIRLEVGDVILFRFAFAPVPMSNRNFSPLPSSTNQQVAA